MWRINKALSLFIEDFNFLAISQLIYVDLLLCGQLTPKGPIASKYSD